MEVVAADSATQLVPSWQPPLLRWRCRGTGALVLPNRTPHILVVVIFAAETYSAVPVRTRAMTIGRLGFSWREDMTIGWVVVFRPLMARQVWRYLPPQSRSGQCPHFLNLTKMRMTLRPPTRTPPLPLPPAPRPRGCPPAQLSLRLDFLQWLPLVAVDR